MYVHTALTLLQKGGSPRPGEDGLWRHYYRLVGGLYSVGHLIRVVILRVVGEVRGALFAMCLSGDLVVLRLRAGRVGFGT